MSKASFFKFFKMLMITIILAVNTKIKLLQSLLLLFIQKFSQFLIGELKEAKGCLIMCIISVLGGFIFLTKFLVQLTK